jgi:hypothetical protein
MKRVAIIFSVLAVLLFADGLYMILANYHPGDANTFFGNQTWNTSDGEVMLMSAGFLALVAVVMWVIVFRQSARSGTGGPEADQSAAGQPGGRTASRA